MGAQSMHDNSTAHDVVRIHNWILVALVVAIQMGAYTWKIALIFTRHFYFEGKASKAYVANKG